jgi:hypothetical protein
MTLVENGRMATGRAEWRPTLRWNDVSCDGKTVVKRSVRERPEAYAGTEREALRVVAGVIPVPRLLTGPDPGSVYMAFMPGVTGDDWLRAGLSVGGKVEARRRQAALMRASGRLLNALHTFDAPRAASDLPGCGPVVVHGDFAPHNVLVDPATGDVEGVIDWEQAHLGSPVEDLAWLEWYLRIWSKAQAPVLGALYDTYGERPEWSLRHDEMIRRCHGLLATAPAARRPEKEGLLRRTEAFVEF